MISRRCRFMGHTADLSTIGGDSQLRLPIHHPPHLVILPDLHTPQSHHPPWYVPFTILSSSPSCHPERSEGSLSPCNASAARFNLANESSTPLWSILAPKCSSSQPIHPGGSVKSHPNCTRHDTPSTGVQVKVA